VSEEDKVAKIAFNAINDFKLLAAYEAYSKSYDKVEDVEDKMKLNELISKLYDGEISYGEFYRANSEYVDNSGRGYRRARIQSARKREYRRDQLEKDRNRRHRK
jgi:hypothetical protein